MKVLMFGWEFPPHISGGLGTACAGLTRALGEAGVDVIFVVPKLQGGEHAGCTTFLNASTFPILQKRLPDLFSNSTDVSAQDQVEVPGLKSSATEPHLSIITSKDSHTVIEVSSFLSPYHPAHTLTSDIERWNYSFDSGATTDGRPRASSDLQPRVLKAGKSGYIKKPYQFSGAYGPNLMEEITRYAQAGAEIAKGNLFDMIHAHDWMTFPAGIAAKRISGKQLVVHVHATEIDRSGKDVNPHIFEIEREGMTIADKVVTVSQWTKDIAIRHYGIAADKIEVVHNGIARRSNEYQIPVHLPLDSPVVTFLGRITHQKGPMYFVEAARKVHERFPDAHFVVAGSGDQLPAMLERIGQLRLSSRFHFTGFLRGQDINRVWAMSTVYVMPSVSEPFGLAPLEAIQAGVPVVLSKQAGVGEVMPHAIKVDFWNTDALSEAICSVLRYKSLANTLRRNGAEELKSITWEKSAHKLTTLYYDLARQQQGTEKESGPLFSGPPTSASSGVAILRHRDQQGLLRR